MQLKYLGQHRARGSVLLVVVVILAVMALGIAAALMVSSRERAAAASQGRADSLKACAQAASRRIWAEVANSGGALVGGVWALDIADGPMLALGHYDQNGASFTSVTTTNITNVKATQTLASASGGVRNLDTSNTFRVGIGDPSGSLYFAHCVDGSGNQYEVELFARFGL